MDKAKTIVNVGISDLNVVKAPNVIRTSGLGSCVGVVIYDLYEKVAGLAHIMLPDSKFSRQANFNPYKYADTAIPILIEKLYSLGARANLLQAKLAGGSQMFQFSDSDVMRIGPRNVEAVKYILKEERIPIISKDVGGNRGRTIEFDPRTGLLMVRSVNQEPFYI